MSGLSSEDVAELARLSEILDDGTYYDLFGLSESFERKALKRAYYDLSRRFHPDRFYRMDLAGQEEVLERVFAGINEAYRVLGSDDERNRYDADINGKKPRRRKRSRPRPEAQTGGAEATPAAPPPRRFSRERQGTTRTAKNQREVLGSAQPEAEAEPEEETQEHVISWSRSPQSEGGDAEAAEASQDEASVSREASREARKRKRKRPPQPEKELSPGVRRMREQILRRMRKARAYYKQGLAEAESGEWIKAASSFYLAMTHDERNEEYKVRFAEADRKGKHILAAQHLEKARKAESFRNHQEALNSYRLAADCDPDTGEPWFRLAQLVIKLENDQRAALGHYRRAVEKEPNNIEYRMALAESYELHEMRRNAHREYQAVLDLRKDHAEAKEGAKRTR
ncbi:MAG: DnaJ domain-containing protein [Alphaproteobacteria bacterium]|nr:DnaJ domain-containing protein [Alphaproteobacteria bacterium]